MSSGLSLLGSGLAVTEETSGASITLGVGTTAVSGGTNGRILYDNSGVLGELATTGSGSVVRGTTPTLTTPIIGTTTWASVPAAASYSGSFVYVTDFGVGGALMRSNGTRWLLVGYQTMLKSLDATSSNVGNSETIVFQYQMPTNLLQNTDRIRLFLNMAKSGTTDTGGIRFRMGTAGTTGDTGVYSPTILSTSQRAASVIVDMRLESATSIQLLPNPFSGYGQAGTTALPSPVAITSAAANSLYLNVSILSGGAADTVALTGGQIWLVNGT